MPRRYFYCITDNGDRPHHKHETREAAIEEAGRLATSCQRTVEVMEVFAVVKPAPRYVVDELEDYHPAYPVVDPFV